MTAWFLDLNIYTFKIILQLKAVAHFGMFSRKMFFHVSFLFFRENNSWVKVKRGFLNSIFVETSIPLKIAIDLSDKLRLFRWNFFSWILILEILRHWLTGTGKIQNFLEKLSKNHFESSTHQKIISIKCDLNKKQSSKLTKY